MRAVVNRDRFFRGLDRRLALGKCLVLRQPVADQFPDAHDVAENALYSLLVKVESVPLKVEVARIALKFPSISAQMRFLDQFGDNTLVLGTRLLTVGALFHPTPVNGHDFGDADYSIVSLNSLLEDTAGTDIRLEAAKRIGRFLAECKIIPPTSVSTLSKYFSHFGVPIDGTKGIEGLSAALHTFKQTHWGIIGPDIISVLQGLCDPHQEFTLDQLNRGDMLSSIWQLRSIFLKLVVLRALGGYPVEREFVLGHPAVLSQQHLFSDALQKAVLSILRGDPFAGYLRAGRQIDHLNRLLVYFANIKLATKNHNLEVVKKQVALLYSFDSRASAFVDWLDVHNIFELPSGEADVFTIFIKVLMATTDVAKRFLTVALARGRGQLVADLTSLVSRLRIQIGHATSHEAAARVNVRARARTNSEFLRLFRPLPVLTRHRLIDEVLDKGMMERLAFAFPTSISLPTDGLPRVDNQASILRLELAKLATREQVIDEREAAKVIDEETHFLRMHRFHTLFRAGRIKIDWEYLEVNIAHAIERQFNFLLSEGKEESIYSSVFRNVVSLFAQEVADILLFDSESSLEQALSNNLRHGVLVPRFIRAFNEAFVSEQGQFSELTESSYSRLGKNSELFLKLKEIITGKLDHFKNYWLTVDRGGEFYAKTKEVITSLLIDRAEKMDATSSWILASKIIDAFKGIVEDILAQALHAFSEEVKVAVMNEIRMTRLECNKAPTDQSTAFLDLLEIKVLEAFDEVAEWLGLTKIEIDVPDFELTDLIKFETVSLVFSDFKKLRVRYGSYEKRDKEFVRLYKDRRARGRYFEAVQEVVHNLISNAYKYSEQGMNTEIDFRTLIDGDTLVFRCVNSFAERAAETIIKRYPDAVALTKEMSPEQARRDVLSGFQKIRNVCARIFGRAVTINIPPLSPRSKQYIVEIKIDGVAKEIFLCT